MPRPTRSWASTCWAMVALIAMHAPGGKIDPVNACICIHPTFSEGVKAAAGNLQEVSVPTAAGALSE